ncbi:hypothetical protein [Ferruginibacter albus]|uniref:hypothetical protein n=1 Tax=Ferruginibacter albus TaxID=2875540 RepID=UPI001CC7FD3F|nr:hypothetical protein [Ferruginibacter albus]UAY53067.1 hypothetical protein K9M53_05160 [Ferruginibacter albus]
MPIPYIQLLIGGIIVVVFYIWINARSRNKKSSNKAEGQNTPTSSLEADPTTDVHTKNELDTPQFTQRDRSSDSRAEQNNQ